MTGTTHLGKRRKLIEGPEKITGQARYTADLTLPGLLHARVVLSPYPHARIRGIDVEAALGVSGVVAVLTGRELNGGHVAYSRPSLLLAEGEVVFAGQPVAVVVANTEAAASDGASLLDVDYEALDSVDDAAQAEADETHVWPHGTPSASTSQASLHGAEASTAQAAAPSNVDERRVFQRGDVDAALQGARVVIDRTYLNARVHQAYLEPHAVVAQPGVRAGEVTVYTSTQGQYAVRSEVANALGLRERDVHVVPMTVGGGFGAKYGILDSLVTAVALHLARPVRLVLTRSEDMLTTTPTPETSIRVRIGADERGRIVGLDVRATIENGVFRMGHAGIIATIAGGMYRCEHVRVETVELLTNRAPVGAYRAPGVPQALFALESSVDELARALEIDPLEFRLMNAVEGGDLTGTGRPWPDIGLKACLERAREHPLWQARGDVPNEGVGLAVGGWPGGFSPAGAVCRVDSDGTVRLHVGSVDISGVHSSMVLIVAETLGLDPDNIEIVQGTTDSGPYAPNSGGSQVTISLGGAVLDASRQVREQLRDLAAAHLEAHRDDVELVEGRARVKGVPSREVTFGQLARLGERMPGGPGPVVAEGRASLKGGAPGFTAHLVRVRVDPDTGVVTPLDAVTIQDVGFALNPLLVEGQVHGGTAQALGIGLYEGLHFESGAPANPNFLGYVFPRAADLPPLEAVMVERPSEHGPFGARIVGEPPITGGAAAVANAVRDAVGVRVTELPITSEALWRLMREVQGE
ncbi:xanthine dehydrogenase family protein molybdopterin-binding subunit [Deinococcus yavapaiensis]|uniref:CO/xanthine dehydrogenase Mo-binding subunit n=1 Tax=Deinococcus yavapaiensis KR-236 TaxID=694435 RepID=A0A318S3Z4_9DEIO|nr:xanthine dehydrogenase family protein molybdopterin-binding subunit [Deinococcus yavapaiensis]PYE52780.1 CO/xanthine dehydrogenase Mo-binding subunit [Deinococcus yavapaiensis KR-236]